MRKLIVFSALVLLVVSLQAQLPDGVLAYNLFLVQYSTIEKCYECSYRYLAGCVGDCGKDFNVPDKTVTHYERFNRLEDVLRFLNRENSPIIKGDSRNNNLSVGTEVIFTHIDSLPISPVFLNLPDSAFEVSVFELRPLAVEQEKIGTVETIEQQPVIVVKDKFKWVVR